jgi:hypothetical protein
MALCATFTAPGSKGPPVCWGHSLGLDWGSPWIESTSSTVIRPGMCFAIERRIEAPGIGGANYENNVIVTDTGPEIVTPPPTATVSNEQQASYRTTCISLTPGERYGLDQHQLRFGSCFNQPGAESQLRGGWGFWTHVVIDSAQRENMSAKLLS